MSSLSSWRAWIEIHRSTALRLPYRSLSSWRAWIEISRSSAAPTTPTCRSPHGERGLKSKCHVTICGGVGRSPHGERGLKSMSAAICGAEFLSLSSWRAWIEITTSLSVDSGTKSSLSSWRAWIEMTTRKQSHRLSDVALLMESVD